MVGEERPAERIRSGRIELAEVAAEGEHLRVCELLAAHADHQVLEPGGAKLWKKVANRAREIDAADLGAQRFGKLRDLKQVPR